MPENRWDQDLLTELACMWGIYGKCMVVPEESRGELLVKELRDRGVTIYEQERKGSEIDCNESTGLLGWQTTPETKRYLVENMARHIRQYDKPGCGLRIAFQWIIDECRTFVRHKDGTEGALKIAGCHDDFVIFTGISLATISSATTYLRPRLTGRAAEEMPNEGPRGAGVW